MLDVIAFFLVGMVASFIGTIAGGGGLVSIPLLILLGLPPQVAISTNKLGGLGLTIGATIRFWKTGNIQWKYTGLLCLLGVAGGYVGANILLSIDQEHLSRIIGVMMLVLIPLFLLKKEMGVAPRQTSPMRRVAGYGIFFLTMVYGGFFGGGASVFLYYVFINFFGFTFIQSNATSNIPWFFLSITALIVFGVNGTLQYGAGIPLFVGMLAGSYLGTHVAIKKGDAWVKGVFVIVSVVSAIKLLFF